MILKGIVDEDFSNYKLPSMYLAFPKCSFKCDKENGCAICQNSSLVHEKDIEISVEDLLERYNNNKINKAIVCGGLEPFDSIDDLLPFIHRFRLYTRDPVVIYTGYTKEEIEQMEYIVGRFKMHVFTYLQRFENIIIKYGRFIPNQEKHYDEILGVNLASDNQYAEVLEEWYPI